MNFFFFLLCLRYALEGVHGTGKTSLIDYFKKLGYTTMDENFIKIPKTDKGNKDLSTEKVNENDMLHPQSFQNELKWILRYQDGLYNMTKTIKKKDPQLNKRSVIFADRSLESSYIYAKDGNQLLRLSTLKLREGLFNKGIILRTIYLKNTKEVLTQRLSKRDQSDPIRKNLKEDDEFHLNQIFFKYETSEWDYVVDCSSLTTVDIAKEIFKLLDF